MSLIQHSDRIEIRGLFKGLNERIMCCPLNGIRDHHHHHKFERKIDSISCV